MKKELISGFVDSELDEKEWKELQNGNKDELKELVEVYRMIGDSIRYNESQVQVSDQFKVRLKEALQQEYSDRLSKPVKNRTVSSDTGFQAERIKEESVM